MADEPLVSNQTFTCSKCFKERSIMEANCDKDGELICDSCYLTDPPPDDVAAVISELDDSTD